MSLTLRKGIWHFRKMIDGHTLAFSTKTGDEKLAKEIATIKEAEFLRERVIGGRKSIKLHKAINTWLKLRQGSAGYENAKRHIMRFTVLPDVNMQDLTQMQVQNVVDAKRAEGAKPSYLGVMVNYWNCMVKWVAEQEMMTGPKLQPIKSKGRIRYLTEEEQARWLAVVDPDVHYPGKSAKRDAQRRDNYDLLVGLLDLGCRYAELANMNKRQVDLEAGTVVVYRGKGSKTNTLFMTDRVKAMFERRFREVEGDLVFPTKFGKHNNDRWVHNSRKRAGLGDDVSLHTARHTYLTTLVKAGVPLPEVQQIAGHANIATTMLYVHVCGTDAARKAAEVLNKRNEKLTQL